MRKITKRSLAIGTAVVVAVGGAGAAFAAWSLNSTHGTSTAAGSASPLTVSNLVIDGTLVPGTPVSVKFSAHNPNSFPVKVSAITFSDVRTSTDACSPSNLITNPSATLPTNLTFAKAGAGGDSQDINYVNVLQLKTDPQDGCQKATFAFNVNLAVASSGG